jgi:iron-sulfur cluster assembly protein
MGITLTELAAKEIKRVIAEQQLPESVSLRIGVAGGGCSGFEYRLGFEEAGQLDQQKDAVSQQHGIRLAIDKKSALYLDGTVIDFHEGIDRRGFVFDNPNAVKTCGCGSSFQA